MPNDKQINNMSSKIVNNYVNEKLNFACTAYYVSQFPVV